MPKPFQGHIRIIQRNAIKSWTRLKPCPEIILFGWEEGIEECASQLGLDHLPEVARNAWGTPLLADIFRQAEQHARHDLLVYVNADIILPQEFMIGVNKVRECFPEFLAVGRRTNLDILEPLDFHPGWEARLREKRLREGVLESHTGIDFFAFLRGTYRDVPPLAIGRIWFDQWCIKHARKNGLPVIDMTKFAPIVHQLHDYNHVPGGKFGGTYGGIEADENLVYYGERPHTYTILSATHEITERGQIRRLHFRKQVEAVRQFFWKNFVDKTYGVRKRLGLRRRPQI